MTKLSPGVFMGVFLGAVFGIVLNPIVGALAGILITALYFKISIIEIEEEVYEDEMHI